MKLALFYIICVPLALVWDLIFFLIKILYKGATYLDRKGEVFIQNLRVKLIDND
jgi:hypothetical protein